MTTKNQIPAVKKQPWLFVVAERNFFSFVFSYLKLSEISAVFSVFGQQKKDITFRPTAELLAVIVKKGLVRETLGEKIEFPQTILDSLVVPVIGDGLTWGKMRDLYALVKSIPFDMNSSNATSIRFIGFNRIPVIVTFHSQGKEEGLATFESVGIKITMPFRRCHFKPSEMSSHDACMKIIFRKNSCFSLNHPGLASWCRNHDSPGNCHRCLAAGAAFCQCGAAKYPGRDKPYMLDGCQGIDGKGCVGGLSGVMCFECHCECIRQCEQCDLSACETCAAFDFCEECGIMFCKGCGCCCDKK